MPPWLYLKVSDWNLQFEQDKILFSSIYHLADDMFKSQIISSIF